MLVTGKKKPSMGRQGRIRGFEVWPRLAAPSEPLPALLSLRPREGLGEGRVRMYLLSHFLPTGSMNGDLCSFPPINCPWSPGPCSVSESLTTGLGQNLLCEVRVEDKQMIITFVYPLPDLLVLAWT